MRVPVVEFDGIGRTYPGPPPVRALVGVHARIDEGDYVTVVGPSGSGKSTFLNLVGLLDLPTEGTYRFGGVDTSTLDEDARTGLRGARIGFVFQAFHLMNHRSAAENVELALLYNQSDPRLRAGRAAEALAQVGLAHRAHALPSQLSGGERQRVAIARALVHRPALLLCDEPTGNLDSATAREVLELIDALHAGGLTVVVITHDREVAARGRRTFAIHDGRLSEPR